jgi:hypothetical protein
MMIARTLLLRQGWSATTIKQHLGPPDEVRGNRRYYDFERVLTVEFGLRKPANHNQPPGQRRRRLP